MSSLDAEQRREVIDIITQNNAVLMANFREGMNEALSPLKDLFNKAIAKNDVLNNQIDECKKKIETLFIFHNQNTEKKQSDVISLVEVKKDIAKIQSDISGLLEKINDNKVDDKEFKKKIEHLEHTVSTAQASYGTLAKALAVMGTLLGLAIAGIGLFK